MTRRLTRLRVENYRSIRGRHSINLDAPVVLIHGANGSGKTSLLSALEIGLTGQAAAMRRTDPSYFSHLVHFGTNHAKISIEYLHDALTSSDTEQIIQSGEMIGEPILPPNLRRLYTERCFLSQTTLARLLDIYEQRSGDADDALTRFVHDLIGLDHFDNLLAGIHHARHISRFRNVLPGFAEVEQAIENQEQELRELAVTLRTESEALEKLSTLLDTQLRALGYPNDEAHQLDLINFLSSEDDEAQLVLYRSMARELESALSHWHDLSKSVDQNQLSLAERQAAESERRWENWRLEYHDSISFALQLFNNATSHDASTDDREYHDQVEDALTTLRSQAASISVRQEADRAIEAQLLEANEASEKVLERLARIDRRISALSEDSGPLARALSEIEPFVTNDICPVCHRNFAETGGRPLHSHIIEHISTLASASQDLRALTAQRQTEQRAREALDSRLTDLNARRRAIEVKAEDDKTLVAITEARVALESVRDAANAGGEKFAYRRQCLGKVLKLRRDARTLEGLRESILHFPARLSLEQSTESESTLDILNRCSHAIRLSIGRLDDQIAAKMRLARVVDEVSAHKARVDEVATERAHVTEKLGSLKKAFRRSEATRAEARRLAGYVETVRTRIVSRVFNDQLNGTWRDLFIRLAPDEQFVPAFKSPRHEARKLQVQLETRRRDGASSGHPKSVLSAGNLNTAALTLFLSLHLNAEPILPWLVIDDPVQSMDEIHTSQFAALVRTLTRRGGRQVIIAVHERALFDYLALELAPASRNDRLNTVQLFKEMGEDTVIRQGTKVWEPSFIFSRPEAHRA
ncbi:MAG: AAA family ATPase [Chloroflexi bacterium]|nr:AAA family ATPase [Chloroflexota bacterium]